MKMWGLVIGLGTTLGLISYASNIAPASQLAGDADVVLAARLTVSKYLNAGTIWAGLGILSGWCVRHRLGSALAGVLACELALVVHYVLGQATGMYDISIFSANVHWFIGALLLGAPLGLIGNLARRPDRWGVAARLVAPIGALTEPFVLGMFTPPTQLPWPGRFSSTACGALLLASGLLGGATMLTRWWKRAR